MKDSYNSVGSGATPKLGCADFVPNKARPGGASDFKSVHVEIHIPKAARSGGATATPKSGSEIPKAARPGGSQKI